MSAGHDLQREDEAPEFVELLAEVIAAGRELVDHASPTAHTINGAPLLYIVNGTAVRRLADAIDAATRTIRNTIDEAAA